MPAGPALRGGPAQADDDHHVRQLSAGTGHRAAAFDSGLTIPDFAACLSMGMQPVGLVQGYYYGQVASWSNYSYNAVRSYPCACYETAPHNPGWVGRLSDLDAAWVTAHAAALSRMLQRSRGHRGSRGGRA